MNIIISNKAHKQIQEIFKYISQDSVYYAKITKDELYRRIQLLSYMPYMGRKIPEYNKDNMREIIYKSYRIMYKIIAKKQEIHIENIQHGKQNFNF